MDDSLNQTHLLGYIGADAPKVQDLGKENRIAVSFTVATGESHKNRENPSEYVERTEWHRINITNQFYAKYAVKNLHPGARVLIRGKSRTRSYIASDGKKTFITEVCVEPNEGQVLLITPSKKARQNNGESESSAAPTQQTPNQNPTKQPEPSQPATPPPPPTQAKPAQEKQNTNGWDTDPRTPSAELDLSDKDLDDEIPF